MVWPVLALMIVAAAISLPATAVLVRLGHRLGALDSAGATGHDKTLRPVPNLGGIAIYLGVALPLAVGLVALAVTGPSFWQRALPAVVDHLERLRGSLPAAAALLACLTALHVTGLIDDRRGLGPWTKLAVQLATAAVMAIWFDVRLLTFLGVVPSVLITVLWIVVITNSINFLDNMDGLAGGITAIAGTVFMAATLINHQWFVAATLALLVGALIGFLVFNFPPARIFMGDGGSLVVGFLLGVLTARTTFVDLERGDYPLGSAWYGLLMPLVILAVPLYDFITVTAIRLWQRRSPFIGDQQHYSHRLVQRGLSRRGAVVVIWAATLVTGLGGIGLGRMPAWQALLTGIQTLAVLLMLALLEHASRHAARRDKPS
jgi:UDP-GlcNAc:undecaprenyl-phosphate GlcNAc-1-phosphate transferase